MLKSAAFVVLRVLESGTLAAVAEPQAAIRFALGDPRVGVVLVGFSAMDHVAEAAAAANGQRLSDADLEHLEALYANDFLRSSARI